MTSDTRSEGEPSFDLLSRPWLPVQRLDGTEAEISLKEIFAQAGEVRRLVGDVPTQEFALLRLLLAIVHDAVDGPEDIEDWAKLWHSDEPFASVPGYLDRHRDRFDLLHPATPFFQVAGLRTAKDEVASLNRIVADVPNGEPFFTMRSPGVGRLGFAEAARWVVHAHAFDPSGIKSGAVGDPKVKSGKGYPQGVGWAGNLGGVLAEGATLRETLLLNLVARDTTGLRAQDDDRPAWRRDPPGPAEAKDLVFRPSGLRDLYTWQSRRLRLHYDDDGVYGVVLSYGDRLAPQNMHHSEPMTGWRRSAAQEKKLGLAQVFMPREHQPDRAAWRGLESLLADRAQGRTQRQEAAEFLRPLILNWVARLSTEGFLPRQRIIRARTFGAVYGTQQSVIDEVVEDGVTMAMVLLNEQDPGYAQRAVDAVADADAAVRALGDLATALADASGAEAEPRKTAARDLGYATLDGPFRRWLRLLGEADDPYEARRAWQREAHRIIGDLGRRLLDEAGDAAWEGRLVEGRGGKVWLNASLADLRFRANLNRALHQEPASGAEPVSPAESPDQDLQKVPS